MNLSSRQSNALKKLKDAQARADQDESAAQNAKRTARAAKFSLKDARKLAKSTKKSARKAQSQAKESVKALVRARAKFKELAQCTAAATSKTPAAPRSSAPKPSKPSGKKSVAQLRRRRRKSANTPAAKTARPAPKHRTRKFTPAPARPAFETSEAEEPMDSETLLESVSDAGNETIPFLGEEPDPEQF